MFVSLIGVFGFYFATASLIYAVDVLPQQIALFASW
jgi:hypothetical protein